MIGAMGLQGLCLALIGLYAVVAYSARRRSRELGIRISLGATRRRILAMVMREGALLAAIGIGVGLGLSVPVRHALGTVLEGLGPLSPWALVVVPACLLVVTMSACLLPAWRASLVDPLTVLRLD
jgi:putative ABC transport system permease protein